MPLKQSAGGYGNYFDDFSPGDVFLHEPGKTILESDNNLFCLLTMNHHPVHLDNPYALSAQHGRILVVGTLVFSLTVGMTVRDISGRAIANLGYNDVRHLLPVFIGDTLHAESVVLETRPSRSNKGRGIIKVETKAKNQNGDYVLSFTREVLLPRRAETRNG